MIYIINNSNNKLVTDVWFDYVIEKVQVYFNKIYVGEFYNQSTSNEYLIILIGAEILNDLQLENMEYEMKLYSNYSLFKTETVSVKRDNSIEIYGPEKSDLNIKFYERK